MRNSRGCQCNALASSSGIVRDLSLTIPTYFEICELCKAKNRGSRPWLEPVAQQAKVLHWHPGTAKLICFLFNLSVI